MLELWKEAWPKALAVWSDFVKLRDPLLCVTSVEAAKENLSGSFAMIRFSDQQVVIDLQKIDERALKDYAVEILAHEIGHHVYCPANLTDHARMIALMRKALPTVEKQVPLVANLYSDLHINDRLQRSANLRMAEIYKALRVNEGESSVWQLYMRTYEILWSLTRGTLTSRTLKSEIEGDALLAARLIRAYAHDPLLGAGSFATLLFPYLVTNPEEAESAFSDLFDMESPAGDGEVPAGLSEDEDGSADGLNEDGSGKGLQSAVSRSDGRNPTKTEKAPRSVVEYGEILRSLGTKLSDREIVAAYYRELSSKHLIPFPEKQRSATKELQAEGLELWDIGAPMENVDWFHSMALSPVVIPGVTVVERHFSEVNGPEIGKGPLDLYIGIDCSGSMANPAHRLSYPVLAGAVIARSAFRAGSKVMACLSGEGPGQTISTKGFVRSEKEVLELITSYLGTGYSFGIHHLREHIVKQKNLRPTHLLIVSDQDIFPMLGTGLKENQGSFGKNGWDVAAEALKAARGGGTMVLQLHRYAHHQEDIDKLKSIGWSVFVVDSMEEIVGFARNFSRSVYSQIEDKR